MNTSKGSRYANIARSCTALTRSVAFLALAAASTVYAQAWRPDSAVEIVVGAGAGAGGGNDNTARTIQRVLKDRELVTVPISVLNKPGAGGVIAFTYLNQHTGKGNYIGVTSNTLLTNHITRRSPLGPGHFSPLAILLNEYITFNVRTESPLKNGNELIARLKADPESVVVGISSSLGNINHIAFATVASMVNVDPKKVRTVVFKSSSESITALLGGHIDLVIGPTSIGARYLESGQMRILAITSGKRRPGVLSTIPTWKEIGVNAVIDNWRGVIGPKGMSVEHVAFWDAAFGKMFKTPEWQQEVERNHWQNAALNSKESARYMDRQYGQLRRALIELGMAR